MLLTVKNLSVRVDKKDIISNISFSVVKGKISVLMGANGSGKTSLCMALMGHPRYIITKGKILLGNKNITSLPTEKRAQLGMFLSFQEPPEIEGVSIDTLLRTITKNQNNKHIQHTMKKIEKNIKALGLSDDFTEKHLGSGLSGGEKKKNEILQLLAANPKIAILDEIDSGIDIDAVKTITRILKKKAKEGMGILLITHSTKMLNTLKPDCVHIICKGEIITSGNASLVKQIEKYGYKTKK